jgi:hypothetical protein
MSDARWLVRHYVEPLSFYAWQVLSGLVLLNRSGDIDLEFTYREPVAGAPNRAVPWIEVTDRQAGHTRRVCFDLRDGPQLTSARADQADVVFKRTLTPETAAWSGAGPVLPYGLNYPCRSGHEGQLLRYRRAELTAIGYDLRHRRSKLSASRLALPVTMSVRLARATRHPEVAQRSIPRLVSQFEVGPDQPAEAKVVFQTRAWPEHVEGVADHRTAANLARAEVIRSLRRRLGRHFVGGFVATDYSRRHFGDCLSDQPSDPLSYLRLTQRAAVVVSTGGLGVSIPFKLPEYLAASRAVVGEACRPELPAPLVPGTHWDTFTDPEGCADACQRLLDDPERISARRHAAWAYYVDQVRPDALIRNRLADVADLG